MLVLTRRKDEAIQIGDSISVMVVDIQGGKVRLAVSAPEAVPIDRLELRERKQPQPPAPSPDAARSTGPGNPS